MSSMHEFMELTFLGTGGSTPSVHRNVSSVALKRGGEVLLFDCGEGTQRQFQRAEVSYMAVRRIFITHLHGDHILGLPGLLQTMDLNDRERSLEILGPPGIKQYMSLVATPPMPRITYPIQVTELRDGDILPFDGYRIEVRRLDHTIPNLGYAVVEDPRPGRFNREAALELGVPEGKAFGQLQNGQSVTLDDGAVVTPAQVLGPTRRGRKVVYTGDCRPCEATVELALGADILIHDATFTSDQDQANEVGHSTAAQAAWIADKAGVGRLFLTHISPRYAKAEPLVEEARAIFAEADVAEDLASYVVTFPADEPAEGGFAQRAADFR